MSGRPARLVVREKRRGQGMGIDVRLHVADAEGQVLDLLPVATVRSSAYGIETARELAAAMAEGIGERFDFEKHF